LSTNILVSDFNIKERSKVDASFEFVH
jgi:hypothetical protein